MRDGELRENNEKGCGERGIEGADDKRSSKGMLY